MSVTAPLLTLTVYFTANFPSCRVGFSLLGCTNELRTDSELSLFQGKKSPESAEINGVGLLWPGIRRILICPQVNALGLFFQPGKAADTVLEAINISITFGFQQCSSCQGAEATRLTGNAPCPDLRGRNEIPAFPWWWRTGQISALHNRWVSGAGNAYQSWWQLWSVHR